MALDRRGGWWIGSVDRLRREGRERSMWARALRVSITTTGRRDQIGSPVFVADYP